MSPNAFDQLRVKRPERLAAIEALQGQLSKMLAADAQALVEEDRLVQQLLHASRETIVRRVANYFRCLCRFRCLLPRA